ncbi:TolC family protein [Myroides phaeus]|uniref:Outer membrane protein n=1 Tax=Myroides phaeus TaxID=702745 RepID=A0A1G8FFE1_9FLAO|nr:TolC family protein [Myroides phaeus]MEC4115365.1 TolC family protein [Myroides phaeus]SDH80871.1 outer membrane protein [Myroides phaeus]
MNKVSCLLFVIMLAFSSYAQEQWTLRDCVEKGKENSYKLMIASLTKSVAEKSKQSIASYYLPKASLNSSQGYNFGSAVDMSTNSRVSSNIATTQASVNTSLELFNWSNFVENKQQQLLVDYAELSEQEVFYEYQSELLQLFFGIIGTQEFLKIQQQQYVNSEENFHRVKKEVEAGAKPQSDLYDIDFIFHNEKINIQQTENDLNNQKMRLLHLLNIDSLSTSQITLVYQEETIDLFTDYTFNPTLEKFRLNQMILEKDKQLLKSSNLPYLSANYSFGSFYSRPFNSDLDLDIHAFSKQMGDNKSHSIGLQLTIPIFQGGNVIRKVRKKEEELRLNEVRIKESETGLLKQNQEINQEIEQLDLIAQQLSKGIELSQKSFITTQVKYENGKADIFSFNAAKNQLLSAQYALIKNNINRSLLVKRLQLNNTNML